MLRPSGIIWRNREEATEQSEVTAKHGDTKKRSHTEGGSTGVAKRRALPDRIGNTSAIPARSVRVSDPIQQRQVGLLRGPTVEPLFSVRLRCSVAPCLAVRSVASASCLPLTVDHSSRAIHQPGHVEVDQQGGRATRQPQIRQCLRQVDGHQAASHPIVQRLASSSNRIRTRASPRTISSPDRRRTPRDPVGTATVLPFRRMLVPCALRSS